MLLPDLPLVHQSLAAVADERANEQLTSHEGVREATRTKGRIRIAPVLPVDILGAYVLLPRLK